MKRGRFPLSDPARRPRDLADLSGYAQASVKRRFSGGREKRNEILAKCAIAFDAQDAAFWTEDRFGSGRGCVKLGRTA